MDDGFAVVQLPRIAPLRIPRGSKGSGASDPEDMPENNGNKITAEDLIETPPHLRLVRTGFDYGGIGVPLRVINGKLVRDKPLQMPGASVREKIRRLEAQAVAPLQIQTEPICQSTRFSGAYATDSISRMSDSQVQDPTTSAIDIVSNKGHKKLHKLRHQKSFYHIPNLNKAQTQYKENDYGDLSPSPEVYGTNPRPFEISNLDLEATGLNPAYPHTSSACKSEASLRSNYSQKSDTHGSSTTLSCKTDADAAKWFGITDNPYTDQDTYTETLDEATTRILKIQKEASRSLELIYDGRDERLEKVRAHYRKNRQLRFKAHHRLPIHRDLQTSAITPRLGPNANDSGPEKPNINFSLSTQEVDANASEGTLVQADSHPFAFSGTPIPMGMDVASPLLSRLSEIQCKSNVAFEMANKLMKGNALKQRMPTYKAMKKALPKDIREVQKLINDLLMEKSGEHTPFQGLDINRVKRAIDLMMDSVITMGRQVDKLGRSVRGTNQLSNTKSEMAQALQHTCTYLGYLVEYLEKHVYPEKCGKPRVGKIWNAVQALQTAYEEWSDFKESRPRNSI
ncbi:hypothetical protein BGZ60DRAFT_238925 [Tricladium varicosporioides]|nr:hypothetical protein BGZ60DRAFT_238925 [Hymenoscyphus varicosporioides]